MRLRSWPSTHTSLPVGGAFQRAAVGAAQRPVGLDQVALGDLLFDPQVEAVQDAAVAGDALLEALGAGALAGVVGVVVDVLRCVQLIDGGPVGPVEAWPVRSMSR
jgi:hypothetical protein